jgi:nitrogen regulatory protein P-II 1
MKKLEAVIDPFTLQQVKAALTSDGVIGLTISEVRSAEEDQHVERYRSARYSTDWSARIKVELLVQDDHADYLVDVIRAATRETCGGDGSIFIMHVQDAIRIRTGQHGHESAVVIAVSRSPVVRTAYSSA